MSKTTQLINIGKVHENDPNYRYKRETLQTRFLAAKNGQTEMTNLDRIAKQLHAPCDALEKFIQKKLSLRIHHRLLPGFVEVKRIEAVIEQFIQKYILCKKCQYPELTNENVCAACGFIQSHDTSNKQNIKTKKNNNQEAIALDDYDDDDGDEIVDKETEANVVELMHKLYNLRDKSIKSKESDNVLIIEKLLEKCWKTNTKEQLAYLEKRISQRLGTN